MNNIIMSQQAYEKLYAIKESFYRKAKDALDDYEETHQDKYRQMWICYQQDFYQLSLFLSEVVIRD